MEQTREQETALTDQPETDAVAAFEAPNEFAGISDRELLEHLVRKVAQFETLAGQLAETANGHPMLRMAFGKFLP